MQISMSLTVKKCAYTLRVRPSNIGEKISRAKMGHSVSKETINKVRLAHIGIPLTEEHKQKIGLKHKGKILSEETKHKISNSRTSSHWKPFPVDNIIEFKRNCPMCNIEIIYRKRKYLIAAIINNAECRHCYNAHNNLNKKFSSEHKTRLRLSAIKRIEDRNGIIWPNYNIEACKIMEEYGKANGYNFQHAENGGEYRIPELGYWVDGYDKTKNVVIEYYENAHKRRVDKDERRKQEIIEYLGCKFIELKEWEMKNAIT